MSQVSAWCKSPDVPRVPMEQKRAITKGNKLDYFILSSPFFFSPIYYCWWCDRKCWHRFIYLGSGYVMWTLEGIWKVLESILPKRKPLEKDLSRNSIALLWCPWIPRETPVGCLGMVFLLELAVGKPFFVWSEISYKLAHTVYIHTSLWCEILIIIVVLHSHSKFKP